MLTFAAAGPVPVIAIAGEARSARAGHIFEGLETWSAELKRSSAISKTCVPSR